MAVNMAAVWLVVLMCFSFVVVCICLWRASENRIAFNVLQDLQAQSKSLDAECGNLKSRIEDAEEAFQEFRKDLGRLAEAFSGMKEGGAAEVVSALDAMESLKRQCAACESQWQAIAERLDAQGARVLELEHRVSVAKPVVPES